jgi:hypothetical protein
MRRYRITGARMADLLNAETGVEDARAEDIVHPTKFEQIS